MIGRSGRWGNCSIEDRLLALFDPQAFRAWFGLSVAVTRVGRARASRPTHSLCYVTPLAYSEVVSG
jgi:hypothetical protein